MESLRFWMPMFLSEFYGLYARAQHDPVALFISTLWLLLALGVIYEDHRSRL